MKRCLLILICAVFFMGIYVSTGHATLYTGSLQYTSQADNSDGLVVGGSRWPTYTLTMSWEVTNEDASHPGYPWKYTYTFDIDGNQGGISHIIIETSGDTDESDFDFTSLTGIDEVEGPSLFTPTGQGVSNEGMPGDLYGIKFEPSDIDGESPMEMTWTFYSDRAPTWGDFYTKDGNPQGITDYAYNTGFTANDVDPTDPPSNGSIDYHILRPDTVPEPVTIGLMLLGSWLLSKKRRA